ncbi:MAG TPA: DUF2142 domain-containing protein [Candidatus Saccharimonadales bacterium]|nr:DUF2142 domain-containing protein [Candidatus Saccharimonadales bacterium]
MNKLQPTLTRKADRLRKFMGSRRARQLVLALFVAQCLVLVFSVRFGTPPDENNHIDFITFYANHSLSPWFSHQKPTSHLGDKTREVDYLYHYSMSLVYRVTPLSAHNKFYLIRLFSVGFGLLALLILIKICRRMNLPDSVTNTGLLALTNLPMVLFMCAAVNNDVLVWVGIFLGILLLMRLWEKPTTADLLWLLDVAVLGGLVKRDLLPMGVLFVVLAIVIFFKQPTSLLKGLRKIGNGVAIAAIVLIVGLGLFAERVGGNIIRYHAVIPSCEQVQGVKPCYNFWSSARARSLARQPKKPLMPLPTFVARWYWNSVTNIVDIQAQFWRHAVRPAPWLTPMLSAVFLSATGAGLVYDASRWRRDHSAHLRLYVAAIALYYMASQMLVNLGNYMHYRVFGIALNGRYVIPSVLILGLLDGYYIYKLLSGRKLLMPVAAIILVLAIILGSGLLMMLRNTQLYTG